MDPVNPNQNKQNGGNVHTPVQPQAPAQGQGQVYGNNPSSSAVSSVKPELGPVVDTAASENQDFENQPLAESSG